MAVDTYYNNVSLLLHCDGVDASTTFTDNAPSPHTITAVNQAQIDTAQSKFGGASGLFDGTTDYLRLDGSSQFAFGTGDYTIEMWVRLNATGSNVVLIDFRPSGTNGAYPYIDITASNVLAVWINTAYQITGTTALTTGQWYHVALARSGSTTKLFLDGVQEGSSWTDSSSLLVGASRPIIGANGGTLGSNGFNGWIDDIRITKGIARYTTNFTAPTEAFPDSGPTTGETILTNRLSKGKDDIYNYVLPINFLYF